SRERICCATPCPRRFPAPAGRSSGSGDPDPPPRAPQRPPPHTRQRAQRQDGYPPPFAPSSLGVDQLEDVPIAAKHARSSAATAPAGVDVFGSAVRAHGAAERGSKPVVFDDLGFVEVEIRIPRID